MARKRKRISRLNDVVKFQITALAKFGFSHRFLAAMVFHKTLAQVSDGEIASVSGYCHRRRIRVSDWRNGLTALARQYATRGMKPPKKKKRQRRLRVAA